MTTAPTSTGIMRRFAFMAAALALLGAFAVHRAWPPVGRAELVGTFQRATPLLLPVGNTPRQVVLHTDGTMDLMGLPGQPTVHGRWYWDPHERVVRTDDPRWDHRIWLRSTLLGPRLCMRICDTPLLLDQEERDESVDYVRTATPSRP